MQEEVHTVRVSPYPLWCKDNPTDKTAYGVRYRAMAKRLTREYFQEQGALGGKKGATRMTAAARKARALKASKAAAIVRTKKKNATKL